MNKVKQQLSPAAAQALDAASHWSWQSMGQTSWFVTSTSQARLKPCK